MDADEALKQAEVAYLVAHGWASSQSKIDPEDQEYRWSLPLPEYEDRHKYQGISLQHAVNAQKMLSRVKKFMVKNVRRDHTG